ncbi:10646_t:CDS:2 [Funneliformis mosseae]|uniref:10646_t:CDS:1 n=1 Tax=Funneliformis mosseae TaxID=27381 RepID=A0A9N9ANM3_FUNMO|nr:10646_t:CDS:2 [Funneliformis mosseae]
MVGMKYKNLSLPSSAPQPRLTCSFGNIASHYKRHTLGCPMTNIWKRLVIGVATIEMTKLLE